MSEVKNMHTSGTPPKLRDSANLTRGASLPEKSKQWYDQTYQVFKKWQVTNHAEDLFTENVLLAYFGELSRKYCPTTLWSTYSMLRSMINLHHKVHIKNYAELLKFLNTNAKSYQPVKAKVFSDVEVSQFLAGAADVDWLVQKVCISWFNSCLVVNQKLL